MKNIIKSIVIICLILSGAAYFMLATFMPTSQGSSIIYVDTTVSGGDGTSWAMAFGDLQDALDVASAGDEMWIAAGTYTPSVPVDSDLRSVTFQLINGVSLYGGFPTGGGDGSFSARDPEQFLTVLSGDLNGDDNGFNNNDENSYHVVTGSATDGTTLLDGVTITGGNANGSSPNTFGGGMYIDSGGPMVQNVIFTGNYASREGGGLFTLSSNSMITNTIFLNNFADYRGGGMSNVTSNPTVINSQFISNTGSFGAGGMGNYYNYTDPSPIVIGTVFSQNNGLGMENDNSHPLVIDSIFSGNNGGGMSNYYSNPTISNTLFVSNTAISGAALRNIASNLILVNSTIVANQASTDSGGGIANFTNGENRHPTIYNTIIWNNSDSGGVDESAQIYDDAFFPVEISYSLIQSWGSGGVGNISDDPLFVHEPLGTDYGDLRLLPDSPAIDTGSNANCTETDYRSIPRPIDGNQDMLAVCDMGAYEFFEPTLSVADVTVFEDIANEVTATFTISLSFNAIITANAAYSTTSGTAVAYTDFLPVSGNLFFAPGEISKTVSVPILNDIISETDEVFYLQLINVENAFIQNATAVGTVIDNNSLQYLPLIMKP